MKRHVTYVLEASDLSAMCDRDQSLEIDVENADSVSVMTDARPKIMDSDGGLTFVDEDRLFTDGGQDPEASDQDVAKNVTAVSENDLESRDVTLEQSLTREGDEEIVRWTATADGVDRWVGSDTPAGALRMLADELEVDGGDA